MQSIAYTAMKAEMEKGTYTEVEAKEKLTVMYAQKMLSDTEYTEFMELAGSLSPNSEEGEWRNAFVALEERVEKAEQDIEAMKQAIREGSTEIPEAQPSEEDGSLEHPYIASRGMVYYKDKYYKDPEDQQVYLCIRDNDLEPGSGLRLDYLPHEVTNIYFSLSQVELLA